MLGSIAKQSGESVETVPKKKKEEISATYIAFCVFHRSV